MNVALGQDALEALVAFRRAFPTRPVAFIGAAALGCHIPMNWRRTEDLDLVVALSIEDASRTLAALTGWSQDERKEHEWRSPRGVLVDVLPVSEQALASGVLVWPRSGNRMNLVGMRHALSSPAMQIAPGLELALPPVPVIALLKMASYLDRPAERERDLSDLAHVIDEYPPADDDRLFEGGLAERGLTLEAVLPFVLGRELAALADATEADVVRRFLQRVRSSDLGRFVANGPWSRFEPEQAESRLDALELGFRSADEAKR
jgi:predicted nucleotidyltransferase